VEIRLFGALKVVVDGRTLPVGGRGERTLLALLACSAGRVVSVDRLIDALWGEDLPSRPLSALQVRVSKLRGQVGDVVSTKAPGYVLEIDPDQVDLHRFVRLVSARRFEAALALRQGPPLDEFSGQAWARAEVARLEELHLAAVEEHVEQRLGEGGDVGLVSELEAHVGANPLRERLRGQLMTALYRTGRSADALSAYSDGRRLLREELGLDPSPELQQLEAAILRQDEALDGPTRSTTPAPTLPSRLSSFVGREADITRVVALLEHTRLVTLVGPGGAGKTSLAVEAARGAAGSFRDGAWFVPLAGVTEAARVAPAIAEAVGVADSASGQSVRELLGRWMAQRDVLLVLDNCEHLIDACAGLVESLLRSADPRARIIATSREALGVPGEAQVPVPALGEEDAVALFAERAASVDPAFVLADDVEAVRSICDRLDRMPLAIELAAARVNMFPAAEIARRLDDRFRLLTGGPRTSDARHRTLAATIDWSYELLTEGQRALLLRLAVFRGGWTLEAAEAVCSGDAVAADQVLDLLTGLVERSVVVAEGGRFRLLETIRRYATHRLEAPGEDEALQARHAHFFLALAERAEPQLRGPAQAEWLVRLRDEDHNLQEALRWCRVHGTDLPDLGLRLAAALGWYWYVGRQVDGCRELSVMLASAPTGAPFHRGRVLQALSLALRPAGCIVHPSHAAAEVARESLTLFAGAEHAFPAALSRLLVAVEGVAGRDVAGSLAEVGAAREVLGADGDRWGRALADFVEMEILLRNGRDEAALPLAAAAASAFEELRDDWGRSAVPMHLGAGLRLAGRPMEAAGVLVGALEVCRRAGLPNNVARVCAELGGAAADAGDAIEAARWYGECERVAAAIGNDVMLSVAWAGYGTVARLQGEPEIARRRFADALAAASRVGTPTDAVVAALTGLAAAQLDAGHVDDGEATLARAWDVASQFGDIRARAAVLEQQARAALARDKSAECGALLLEAGSLRHNAHRPRTTIESRDIENAMARSATAGA